MEIVNTIAVVLFAAALLSLYQDISSEDALEKIKYRVEFFGWLILASITLL